MAIKLSLLLLALLFCAPCWAEVTKPKQYNYSHRKKGLYYVETDPITIPIKNHEKNKALTFAIDLECDTKGTAEAIQGAIKATKARLVRFGFYWDAKEHSDKTFRHFIRTKYQLHLNDTLEKSGVNKTRGVNNLYLLKWEIDNQLDTIKAIFGKVTKVHEGDSVWVVDGEGERHKVRLKHIDAPELDQPFGKEARDYLAKMILNKNVTVEWTEKDRYGRILGIIVIYMGADGSATSKNKGLVETDVNSDLIADGYAWHFKHYSKNAILSDLEEQAKKAKKGLWAQDNPVAPWEWRKKE